MILKIKYLFVFALLFSACKQEVEVISPEEFIEEKKDGLFDLSQESDDFLIEVWDKTKDREIKKIVLHCAAIPEGMDPDKLWYDKVWEGNGWRNPGYHVLVKLNGDLIWMAEFEAVVNGSKGFNMESVHISYSGGIDKDGNPKDTQTKDQERVTRTLVEVLMKIHPDAKVYGHTELNPKKACPSYDVGTKFPDFK